MNPGRILLLTVGTGDAERLEETLLAPLRKSIADGSWSQIILLPSVATAEIAAKLAAEIGDSSSQVVPLLAGDEENVDRCFAHFDRVIAELRSQGFESAQISADFTRGTKAMSAGLVLAAVRHEVARLRYITGARGQAGQVMAGSEIVSEILPSLITARRKLDQARNFMRQGNFAAVLEELPDASGRVSDLWPAELVREVELVRPCAEFYAAWDRLEYAAAAQVRLPESAITGRWTGTIPPPEVHQWVAGLASPPSESFSDNGRYIRRLAVDLLANGQRRMRDRHYEDAILRAYRVLELIGQLRLFDRDFDSGAMPPDDPRVAAFLQELEKNPKQHRPAINSKGSYEFPRQTVARFLKRLGDPLAQRLLRLAEEGELRLTVRNQSVLIHGFYAFATDETTLASLRTHYGSLEEILIEDGGETVREHLRIARFPTFSSI